MIGHYKANLSLADEDSEPLNAGWPVWVLGVSGLIAFLVQRRRFILAFAVGDSSVLLILGCGGAQDYVFLTTPPEKTPSIILQTGQVNAQLDLDSVRARGKIDGAPVKVALPDITLIPGPTVTIESQVEVERT